MADTFRDVEEYLDSLPQPTREVVTEIRRRIHAAVPGAGERVSYGIAAFTIDSRTFVHVAGWKAHVSLYPVPDPATAAGAALEPYRSGRSTAKFLLSAPIPFDLVAAAAVELAGR